MGIFSFFRSRNEDHSAKVAKDRLQVLIAHERTFKFFIPSMKRANPNVTILLYQKGSTVEDDLGDAYPPTWYLRDADGNKSMEVFDLINSEWRAASPAQDIQHLTDPKSLLFGDGPESGFAWDLMSVTLSYAADLVPEIADDIVNVDRAMRWGFSWSHGPFELLDLIGPAQFTERLRAEHREVPKMLALLEASGSASFYQDDTFFGTDSQYHQIPPE